MLSIPKGKNIKQVDQNHPVFAEFRFAEDDIEFSFTVEILDRVEFARVLGIRNEDTTVNARGGRAVRGSATVDEMAGKELDIECFVRSVIGWSGIGMEEEGSDAPVMLECNDENKRMVARALYKLANAVNELQSYYQNHLQGKSRELGNS